MIALYIKIDVHVVAISVLNHLGDTQAPGVEA